ncbi:IS66-like element accessory protein TnpA [Acidocella sp.]|uniref:IS66-like element accessory protein TnpA n=1 Tax=Acidocella sp. TaxID=50710 RepID=UPI00263920AB|nr:transposase [Acidocella sp.]
MHQHSHQDAEYQRVELITGRRRRRDWKPAEKAEILSASMAPGVKIVEVARRYGVSRGLLWTWRREALSELAVQSAPAFVPLRVEDGAAEPAAIAADMTAPPSTRGLAAGLIEVEIGRARVRVEGAVDPEVLRQVLGLIGPAR